MYIADNRFIPRRDSDRHWREPLRVIIISRNVLVANIKKKTTGAILTIVGNLRLLFAAVKYANSVENAVRLIFASECCASTMKHQRNEKRGGGGLGGNSGQQRSNPVVSKIHITLFAESIVYYYIVT